MLEEKQSMVKIIILYQLYEGKIIDFVMRKKERFVEGRHGGGMGEKRP